MLDHELARLAELESKATCAPWGWENYGEKSNNAVLGTFYNLNCEPISGLVTSEVYDEAAGDYKRVAELGEAIAYKEDNANYSDFNFIAALRNAAPALIQAARDAERLRAAIETVLADSESQPGGWGPDVTMVGVLRAALARLKPAGATGAGG